MAYAKPSSDTIDALFKHNPWASEIQIDSANADFVEARRKATIARCKAGHETWNQWALEMLKIKKGLEASGKWEVYRSQDDGRFEPINADSKSWCEIATSDFSFVSHLHSLDFRGYLFPWNTLFVRESLADDGSGSGLQFDQRVDFGQSTFHGDAFFDGAKFRDVAFFEEISFLGEVHFDGAIFSNEAHFFDSTFDKSAWFLGCRFLGSLTFTRAKFKDSCYFEGAHFANTSIFAACVFRDVALFNCARFDGYAKFADANFEGEAGFSSRDLFGLFDAPHPVEFQSVNFRRATFRREAIFDGCLFRKFADFSAVNGMAMCTLSLAGAQFSTVPSFLHAHFQEAPRLDNIRVNEELALWTSDRSFDHSAYWRNLKRLAIQGHDHEREQLFFAGELKSRRGFNDKPFPWWWRTSNGKLQFGWPNGLRYWIGVIYQAFSSFGRSVVRPLGWWFVFLLIFFSINLDEHLARTKYKGIDPSFGIVDWMRKWSAEKIPSITGLSNAELDRKSVQLKCIAGPGNPASAAWQLAFSRALIFGLSTSSAKTLQNYACLYGIHSNPSVKRRLDLPEQFTPVIPDRITSWGVFHSLISTILIFFFLLAVRNQFRIR